MMAVNPRLDLNDLFFFSHVVANGGFAAAGRVLGIPKSKLSRRVAGLEHALGVRLIERSSRRFRVTDVGQAFYERCRNVALEVDQAQAIVSQARGEPHGVVRVSCPTGLLGSPFAEAVHDFLVRHPKVRLASSRRIAAST
jgi:DNA-binding transcriptional LysR family regulator